MKQQQLHKASIDLETLKILNNPHKPDYIEPFIKEGIIQNDEAMETLLDMIVQKTLLEKHENYKQDSGNQEPETQNVTGMGKGSSIKLGEEVSELGIPINITFSEPSFGTEK